MVSDYECDFEGCDLLAVARGLCNGHYHQVLAGKELKPLKRYGFQAEKLCPTCDEVKKRDEFYIKSTGRLQTECKVCLKKRTKARYEATKEMSS